MEFLKLDYVRQHSRLCSNEEDAVLEHYCNDAEETIAAYLNRGDTVDEMVASLTEQYGKVPSNIIQAGLLIVEGNYNFRGSVTSQSLSIVPYGNIDVKLRPYMRLSS